MPHAQTHTHPKGLAIWLIIAGVIGWWAAFQLMVEKVYLLENPGAHASCDFSILVQCGKNLMAAQGSVFGFSNPILGLTGWMAPLVVGVAILAGARFARWFWVTFWVGVTGAFALVCWFIFTSIFVLHTLCPWCMTTWAVTIPTFYVVTLHLFRSGIAFPSARVQHAAQRLMTWVPLMVIVSYGIVILLAQIELNAVPNIWQTIRIKLGWY
ncbi:vitamin K epoxide reductase family protein [Microbacterium sp.]|uniref:vitamin K epoxide reductase family protein n=1 Tax=Microbacterium sp. TaxID=51671 RepID=UPI003A91D5AF